MPSINTRTVGYRGRPLHAMLVPIPIACFVGTLVTDVVYWRTAAMPWADMSAWLLIIGIVSALLAAVAGITDLARNPGVRELRAARVHGIGNLAVIVLSIVNELIHTRDAYTSVVPTGLLLSALVVAILLVTGWNGWTMVYRFGAGVRSESP